MLYDPKWEVQTKPAPYSWASLIAWLETKDPNERYDYQCLNCLHGQYRVHLGMSELCFREALRHPLVEWWIGACGQWTFGAALKRARTIAG